MDYLKRLKTLTNRSRFSDLIPTLSFEPEDRIFFMDGYALGAVFNCSVLIGASDRTVEMLRSLMAGNFPANTLISFHLISSTLVDGLVNLYKRAREDLGYRANDGLSKKQIEVLEHCFRRRCELLERGTREPLVKSSEVLLKNFELVVSIKIPCGAHPTDEDMRSVRSSATILEENLKTMGVSPRRMSAEEYIMLMKQLLRMGDRPSGVYREDVLIKDQISSYDTDVEVKKDQVTVNGRVVKSLSARYFPNRTNLGVMNYLIGDPMGSTSQIKDPFMITAVIHLPDRASKRSEINKRSQVINHQANGPIAKFVPRLISKKEGWDTLLKSMENGGVPVGLWFNVMTFSQSTDSAQRAASAVKTFYQVYGFEMQEDSYFSMPTFLSMLPLCCAKEMVDHSFRFHTMTNIHASQLIPLIADWKGNGPGAGTVLVSRRGQVMLWDPFDSDGSYNAVLTAGSGAGKSFGTCDIVMSQMAKGVKVRIIDQGRSYYKACEAMGGEFIEFSEQSEIGLNPFTHIQNITEEIETLKIIIALMAAPKDGLSDFQMAVLEEVILEVWEEFHNEANITYLSEALLRRGRNMSAGNYGDEKVEGGERDVRIEDIGRMLFPFTRHGNFGRFFDGPANLNYDNNLVVLELGDLVNRKHLQSVVLLLLISHINRECYSEEMRQFKKLIIIDEAWAMLTGDDPLVANFLVGAYRKFRKTNAAAIICTQSLSDLYDSPAGRPILENSPNLIFLQQRGEAIEMLRNSKRLDLGDYGYDLLKSVHTSKGNYSEMFVLTPRGAGIGRMIVDRFTQLLYTTDAQEVAALNRLMASGLTVLEAIDAYIALESGKQPVLAA